MHNVLLHARDQGYASVKLGIGAGFEKRRLGATPIRNFHFMQVNDHYQYEALHIEAN